MRLRHDINAMHRASDPKEFGKVAVMLGGDSSERQVSLISGTAGTLIELVHNQRSLRLEWYIIGLIGLELLLSLYGLVWGGLSPTASGH